MPKRKNPFTTPTFHKQQHQHQHPYHHTQPDADSLPPRAIQTVHVAATAVVSKGTTAVFRALKKAKAFEARKLIKRIRLARTEPRPTAAATEKLEAELAAVKALAAGDVCALAREHVLRTLARRRRVMSSPLWPRAALAVPPAAVVIGEGGEQGLREKARANVLSRMCGAAVVREAVASVVGAVEGALGLPEQEDGVMREPEVEAAKAARAERRTTAAATEEGEGEASSSSHEVELSDHDRILDESEEFTGFSDPPADTPPSPSPSRPSPSPSSSSDDGDGDGGHKVMQPGNDSNDGDGDDVWDRVMDSNSAELAQFDERIGGSSSSSDSGSDSEAVAAVAARDALGRTDDEWSGSDDDDGQGKDGREDGDDQVPPPPERKKKKSAAAATTTDPPKKVAPPAPVLAASQFLPSLMTGYVSGSDSDPDADYYGKSGGQKRGPPEKKQRKNRMGQQARRALWERKFGVRANHVKKAELEARQQAAAKERPKKPAAAAEGKKAVEEGPLHPSWEAARKAKEKQALAAQAIRGQALGRKITFD